MFTVFIRFLTSKITQYVAIVVAVLSILTAVRRSGKLEERNRNLQESFNALEKKNEIHNTVNSMPDDAISERLRSNWSRN
jgi:hypothetical protein